MLKQKKIKQINFALFEEVIEKNPWVKSELYFENQ